MNQPKPDDFRLEQVGGDLIVTFTPTGSRYIHSAPEGQRATLAHVRPAQVGAPGYDEEAVRRMALELARLALFAPP